MTALLVTVAGAAGVYLRYVISSAFHGDALPWATVAINVAGSLALGYLVVAHWPTHEVRTVLGVGFLGGFTTFSTFSVQVVLDAEAGEPGRAMAYVLASVVLGIAAAGFGYWIGHVVRH